MPRHELVVGQVAGEGVADPVVEGVRPPGRLRPVAQLRSNVAPLDRPNSRHTRCEPGAGRSTAPACRARVSARNSRTSSGVGKRADAIHVTPAQERGVVGQRARQQPQLLPLGQHQLVDVVVLAATSGQAGAVRVERHGDAAARPPGPCSGPSRPPRRCRVGGRPGPRRRPRRRAGRCSRTGPRASRRGCEPSV